MPRALITGITGQDGGYLAEQLVQADVEVHGLVRPEDDVPPWLEALGDAVVLHRAEITDEDGVERVFARVGPDDVYNLAGVSSVAQSWEQPVLTAQVNALGVALLAELCWRQQERTGRRARLLQASSAEIFSGTDRVPQDEQTPLAPRSPYGAAKAHAHHVVQVYRSRGLHAVNVILYNHESPRRPVTFVTRKITTAAAAAARGSTSPLRLGNLDARRDWGWAPDYAEAMVAALGHDTAADYVVATGVSHSVRDFVRTAFAAAGIDDWERHVQVDPALQRPTDAVDLVGDPGRALDLLGWSAAVAFDDVVARMVQHDLQAESQR